MPRTASRRRLDQRAGHGLHSLVELIGADDPIDQTQFVGSLSGDWFAGQGHFQGTGTADQSNQALGAAKAGHDARA